MNRFSYFKIYLLSFEGLLNYFYYVQFVQVKIIEFGYFRGHEELREIHHILGEVYSTRMLWSVMVSGLISNPA